MTAKPNSSPTLSDPQLRALIAEPHRAMADAIIANIQRQIEPQFEDRFNVSAHALFGYAASEKDIAQVNKLLDDIYLVQAELTLIMMRAAFRAGQLIGSDNVNHN